MRRPEDESEYLALHGGGTETVAETHAAQADPANDPSYGAARGGGMIDTKAP